MHYCVHLLTKVLPSEEEIRRIMQPYNCDVVYGNDDDDENREVIYPVFTWDWYQIGGRYKGRIKMKADNEDFENNDYYNWGFYAKEERNGRLFWSSLLSTLKKHIQPSFMYQEEDWFMNMGFGDKYMLVDGAREKDVLNLYEIGCYIVVLPDGSAIARESWDGKEFIEDKDFDKKHKKALKDNMDGFIT